MAQKHNIDNEEKPMTRDGRIQGPSRRYRRLRHPSFPAALWTAKNPLLQRGEIGFEIDTHQAKIGDGVTYWNDLPYGLVAEYAWGSIVGDINDQTDLVNFVDDAVSAETDRAMQAESVLQDNIAAEALTRGNADAVLQGNIDAEQTARENADSALSDRITTNADDLAQEISNRSDADDALQGQITANKSTMDDHIANTNNPHQVTKAQVGLDNVDNTSDLNKPISTATQAALDVKQPVSSANYQLGASGGTWVTMSAAQQNALNSGATSANIGQISTNTDNISTLNSGLANEITDRQNADNGLQTQIDALVAKSDVVDIVGTYAELQAYDTTNLGNNDVIKVLSDSTHSNAPSYYRWFIADGVGAWVYIGSESETYTKAETDALLNDKQDTLSAAQLSAVNSGVTSSTVTQVGTNTSDISTINSTIAGYGNIVTHNVAEFATAAQGAKADTAVQPGDLATVAITGSYNDLSDKPTIPADISAHRINGALLSNESSVFFGTSSTAAATAQKVVNIPSIQTLDKGVAIIVLPTATSTVANGTIKLNDFPAYPMRYGNAAITTTTDAYTWTANTPSIFVFDGSYWRFVAQGYRQTYSAMSVAEGRTGTATTGRVVRADYLKQIIQGTTLTGIDTTTTGAVEATDTVTSGIGKLQATKADKSELPTVGNGTITITQGGITKGTFTTNQSGDTTIEIDAGAGSPVWGGIGGTLSNQTDLQNALDSKANSADVYTKTEVDTAVNAKSACVLRRW